MSGMTGPRNAVVTGGTTGIGLACAYHLLRNGYRVAIFSQQSGRVDEALKTLTEEFGEERVLAETVDIRSEAAVKDFFAHVRRRWGSVSVLVCNAGFSPKRNGRRTELREIDVAEWNDVLAVNLTGALLCCQAAAPEMAQHGFGRIIFIGSVAARTIPRIAGISYVTSKAALSGLARSLVSEFSSRGVTINTIAPGRILTGMTGPAEAPANQAALERIPCGRLGHPDDIASAVGFLASDAAGFINGAIIDINGGEFLPV